MRHPPRLLGFFRNCNVRPARRCRALDRGATGLEYALALSVFVLTVIGGIDHVENSTETEYQNSASGIEGLPGNEGFGGGGTPTTSPPTLPTTTTTVVDSGPTSTTTTTTTTPGATTTTTVPVRTRITAVNDVSVLTNGGKWNGIASVQLRTSVQLSPVANASVTVQMSAANGSSFQSTCTTNNSGVCTVTWTNLRSRNDPVLATVSSVTASPAWDGQVTTGNLVMP